MIATLSGIVNEKLPDRLVIDVNGVGYGIYVTNEDYTQLNLSDPLKVYIYEHVREQAYDLYGFTTRDTQELFELLIDVNGVGPKMALNILSIGSAKDVRQAVSEANMAFIQQASGVGKRVAERVVVELKDKVGLPSDISDSGLFQANSRIKDEAIEGLVSLGYNAADAAAALKNVDSGLSTEDRIKQALKEGIK